MEITKAAGNIDNLWGLLAAVTLAMAWVCVELIRYLQKQRNGKQIQALTADHLKLAIAEHILQCQNMTRITADLLEMRTELRGSLSKLQLAIDTLWETLSARSRRE